jgi:HK97 family phage prohead protease
MDKVKREVRTMIGGQYQPKIREIEGQPGRTIEGYAIVFGVESNILVDYWDAYREIIEPGAITAEELKGMDIKMTMYHNREKLLARSNKGVGTLNITVDEVGVKYSFEAPDTVDGNTALELVRRGDLAGSSFMYWTDEGSNVSYEKTAEGILLRHVKKISQIYDMTIAADPAYNETTVTAREIEQTGISLKIEKKGRDYIKDLNRQKRELLMSDN